MRAAMMTAPKSGSLEVTDVPVPEVGPRDVLIRVKMASICGTDLHIYKWDPFVASRLSTPLTLGHEFCGVVEKVGDKVKGTKPGEYVSAEGHFFCDRCVQCRRDQRHICQNLKVLGVDVNGAFAEEVVIPVQNVVKNDADLKEEYASIQDPLGNAVHTVFEGDCSGLNVAVIGAGPIGLMATAVLRKIGASKVFVIEGKNSYRLEIAKKLGADHALLAGPKAEQTVLDATESVGVDEVLEMSGNENGLRSALRIVRAGGGIELLGLYPAEIPVDMSNGVVLKGITLRGIHGRKIFDTWHKMAGLLRSGLNLDPVITHRFKLEEVHKGFEAMESGQCAKVVLKVT
jgi:threonine 3-dehydrogenase